ncbi:hypothetical protein QM797_01975 [Rhodococcus sp. IEGM 1381]|uniref:hypothetical protein n=1 Tax=Rhodococcus sp. IEGM 1381 TaxID=3047085 RepID=UPI0024B6BC00|nr:hypothetical protein [Rhodococcus sp. IEGM 1381]MDI9893480.1 hypothetical protein [Rhodococcus sp. IEGM 1381]
MPTLPNRTSGVRRWVIVAGTLPLAWWCISLTAGALGIGYDAIGDVVSTWNITTAAGLVILIPAAFFSVSGGFELASPDSPRHGRWYATVGLTLTMAFYLLMVLKSVVAIFGGSVLRDPDTWSPELSSLEQWAVAAPYAAFLIPTGATLAALWRGRSRQAGSVT